MRSNCKSKQGFSLVEVSLAILVFAVGVLSVFALFPEGLRMNKQGIDDSRMAIFADEALGGKMTHAARLPWGSWDNDPMPPVAPDIWNNPAALEIEVSASQAETNLNVYRPVFGPDVPDFAVRYNLQVGNLSADNNIKFIRLKAENGEYGSGRSSVFYTEYYYTGN